LQESKSINGYRSNFLHSLLYYLFFQSFLQFISQSKTKLNSWNKQKQFMNLFKQFFIKTSILTFIISIVITICFYFFFSAYFSLIIPFVVLIFFSATISSYYFLIKACEKRFSQFSSVFMLATFGKFFFYIVFMALYLFINRDEALQFLITFSSLYLIYTIFEVASILSTIKIIQTRQTKNIDIEKVKQ